MDSDAPLEAGMPFAMLQQHRRWVGWRWEGDKRTGKRTKVPYAAGSGRLARSNDPATWAPWDAARAMQGVDGIAYSLFGCKEAAALDEDACRNPADGTLLPWAAELVERCSTHTQITPSGTGVRPVGVARVREPLDFSLPRGPGREKVECYAGGPARFICVTDDVLLDKPLADLTAIIEELQAERQTRGNGSSGGAGPEDWAAVLAALPQELAELIRDGASTGNDRSRLLFRAIADLRRLGFTEARIIGLLRAYPKGISARCFERGKDDVARHVGLALRKIDDKMAAPRSDLARVLPTQERLARLFAARHAGTVRFVPEKQLWYRHRTSHWDEDRSDYAFHLAREICGERGRLLDNGPGRLDDYRFVRAVEQFARTDRDLVVEAERWNRDPFLFATPGGTVVLTTGEVRDARPEDFINRCARFTPDPAGTPAPLFLKFLAEITQGNEELGRFLQQWFGYSLSGDVREQQLAFLYGPGGNGKSVLVNVLMRIVGSYGATATMDAFLDSQTARHSTELAMLDGARLVAASEIDPGRYWAESRVKALTGGDPVTARYMRQDNFTFVPVLKLTLLGNRKPSLHKVDDAARRRFNIVPLLYRPERVDRQLEKKLMAEAPAILRWAIDGCLDWQRHGLIRPAVVAAATGVYFEEQNLFDDWIAESCDLDPTNEFKSATASELFSSWTAYAKAAGAQPGGKPDFGDRLVDLGCERVKGAKGVRLYRGIRINPPPKSEREKAERDP